MLPVHVFLNVHYFNTKDVAHFEASIVSFEVFWKIIMILCEVKPKGSMGTKLAVTKTAKNFFVLIMKSLMYSKIMPFF